MAGVLALAGAVAAALTLSAATASTAGSRPGAAARTAACCAGGQGYSTLTQITPGNVHTLGGAWLDHLRSEERRVGKECLE